MTASPSSSLPLKRVFSGVQPTGSVHLGNLLGALRQFRALQDDPQGYACTYCVVDLHALTVPTDPQTLARLSLDGAAALLAVGVDPTRSTLFVQSHVRAHAEMAWFMACIARMGWLERMTQFKDKTAKAQREGASAGLFVYPLLMAADVLAHKATHVPVGEDQTQHLELVRAIARRFNEQVAPIFPEPQTLVQRGAARVMSLRDATKKMSKADPSDFSRIHLDDDADAIAAKIRKARTDSAPLPATSAGLEARPEAKNLVAIYAALAEESPEATLAAFGGQNFAPFKLALTERLTAVIAPIRARLMRFRQDPAELARLLAAGADKARAVADPIVAETRRALGVGSGGLGRVEGSGGLGKARALGGLSGLGKSEMPV